MTGGGLTQDEERAWLAVSSIIQTVPTVIQRELKQSADLTLWEFQGLSMLAATPEKMVRLGELAAAASVTLQHASKLTARLVTDGLVSRERDPADARAVALRITPEGQARLDVAKTTHATVFRNVLLSHCSPDQVRLLAELGTALSTAPHDDA